MRGDPGDHPNEQASPEDGRPPGFHAALRLLLIMYGVFVAGNLSTEFASITGLSKAHVFVDLALTHLALNLPALPRCASDFVTGTQNATEWGVGFIDRGRKSREPTRSRADSKKKGGGTVPPPLFEELFSDQESSVLIAFSTSPNRFGSMLAKLMTAERFAVSNFISPV